MKSLLNLIKSLLPKKLRILIIAIIKMMKVWLQNIMFLPLVILVFILRPFIIVRFGIIDASRIGHLANTAGYLYLRDSEYKMHRYFDVIGCSARVSNQHLMTMFARSMKIYNVDGIYLYCLINACKFWLRDDVHQVDFRIEDYRFIKNSKREYLGFNDSEIMQGQKILEKLGIPNSARWVCIHNRDSKYLDEVHPGRDWNYHDYRDFSVQSMKSAAEELASRGYYVLRMGSISAEPLTSNNLKIIDYTNLKERNDFADIFLLANCHFYLGSDSGIFAISAIFKKPFAFINFPIPEPISDIYYWNTTPFILKRVYDNKKNRMLSLKEIFETGLANTSNGYTFDSESIELIPNTPEDILDLAIEVDERIKGTWLTNHEDEEMQKMFWNIYSEYLPSFKNKEVKSIIGTTFLRKHTDLLD